MKKYLIIKADTNDADYITSKNEVTDEQLELLQPVFKVLQDRRKLFEKTKNWDLRHNWETNEIDNGKTPQDLYVDEGLLTEEQVELFVEFLPYDEYGIHTIEDIEILVVQESQKLL